VTSLKRQEQTVKALIVVVLQLLALCLHKRYFACMATSITIRNIPEKARDELAARAAASGRSLQEYLRAQLIDLASRPDVETVLARSKYPPAKPGALLI
jgi:adenine C2-methylase RlmN of 23S rRNA A2503 and tRNA A37